MDVSPLFVWQVFIWGYSFRRIFNIFNLVATGQTYLLPTKHTYPVQMKTGEMNTIRITKIQIFIFFYIFHPVLKVDIINYMLLLHVNPEVVIYLPKVWKKNFDYENIFLKVVKQHQWFLSMKNTWLDWYRKSN